jgi:ABC-type transport system involved in multi-copper enzyme maturation permease subunit
MKAHTDFAVAAHLIRDTFRQAWASGIGWMMLAVTAVCVLLCASASISGDVALHDPDEPVLFLPAPSGSEGKPPAAPETNPELARREGVEVVSGRVSLAFGAVTFPVSRERTQAVHFLELCLAWGIAGTLGLLMTLVWTAGFLPSFLAPSAASVLLAKPVSRRRLLLVKYAGVLTFVGFQVVLFVLLTWLALGGRTGVWDRSYLWCMPLLLLQFAIFYSVSVLLAVTTRSTVACVFGSVLFWLLATATNYGSVMAHHMPKEHALPPATLKLADAAYWLFPKPIDAGLILFNAVDARHDFDKPNVFRLLESGSGFSPRLSILSQLLFTGLVLALAAYEFEETDY